MNQTRTVKKIITGEQTVDGAGVRLVRVIGRKDTKEFDPFLMLDAFDSRNPLDYIKGFPWHPHRGIETITYLIQGDIEHGDSLGNTGSILDGECQWMTAGSGIIHQEMPKASKRMLGIQLWLNLPAKDKMSTPKYQAIKNSEMKIVDLGENGLVEIIAGEYNGEKGPANTFSPVNLMNAKLKSGGKAEFSFPANFNTAALVVEGSITVNGEEKVPTDHFVLFENEGETFTIEANEDSVVLILSGEPLNEPIFPHGPFVMNTREEIIQAFEDFNTGKFGYLEE